MPQESPTNALETAEAEISHNVPPEADGEQVAPKAVDPTPRKRFFKWYKSKPFIQAVSQMPPLSHWNNRPAPWTQDSSDVDKYILSLLIEHNIHIPAKALRSDPRVFASYVRTQLAKKKIINFNKDNKLYAGILVESIQYQN